MSAGEEAETMINLNNFTKDELESILTTLNARQWDTRLGKKPFLFDYLVDSSNIRAKSEYLLWIVCPLTKEHYIGPYIKKINTQLEQIREREKIKVFYLCDGEMRTCTKTHCYKIGGECRHTHYVENAIHFEKKECNTYFEVAQEVEQPRNKIKV